MTPRDWPTVNVQAPQVDPVQLAATVRKAQEAMAQLVGVTSRAMVACNTFSRVYGGQLDGARRILAGMTAGDLETFRAAALSAYELAAELAADDGGDRAR